MDINYDDRISLCGKYANRFEGAESGMKYFQVLHCYDLNCPVCGVPGGWIHLRRKKQMIEKIKKHYGSLDGLAFRKFVFTLPSDIRSELMSRDELNSFFRIVAGVVKKFFPGRLIFESIHLFGDEDDVYKPHINAYIVERLKNALGDVVVIKLNA